MGGGKGRVSRARGCWVVVGGYVRFFAVTEGVVSETIME